MSKKFLESEVTRREFLKTTVVGGATIGATLSLMPGLSLAQARKKGVYTMKYDCYIGETAEPAVLDNWYLDEIAKRSDGRIVIQKFWSGSLRRVGQHMQAIKDGLSEISMISYGYYPSEVPISRGLEWYYKGCDNADTLLYVCRDIYDMYPELRDEWEKRNNAQVLYFTNWSYGPLMMKDPITTIDELKGKRVRGYGVGADTINRLGGVGMPVVAAEVYTSLERRILDGVFSFAIVTAEKSKLHEQAPYIIESGSGAHAPTTVVMNRTLWLSLPDDLKEVLNGVSKEIYDYKYTELYTRLVAESVAEMVKGGAKFSIFPEAEIQKAKDLVQPGQVNEWVENVAKPIGFDGVAFQKDVDALIKKYHPGELPNVWETYLKNHT
ncbi:MAG: TRAP transporter substrate-binding protein DctP [Syntrophales bacterium]|jgi:TRAP-type C4-dicarboxylate transport system substrate-binding protein|nr:TRAP transporter substrate-binding protein DctP [Syntrophales bacterium]MDX9922007.1 TRAP transporter substrate-binding protein DctP [Syntrophales bacterium]